MVTMRRGVAVVCRGLWLAVLSVIACAQNRQV